MNETLKIIISAEVGKLKSGIKNAKKEISDYVKKVKKENGGFADSFKKASDLSKKALKATGTAILSAGTALLGLSAATAEYRRNQALLASAFETAGGSAESAKETYNDLYRVLGDDGQATEAAQHLAKLTTDQQNLSQWTNICQGVYATFGASLPIESLTEAANETAKTKQLTGALADALNWAGVNEDKFQRKLNKCRTEQEREALIRETLNGLYSEAAANYEKNNAAILAQNEAQAGLQEQLSKLGAAATPIMTMLTNLGTTILAMITPYIEAFVAKYLPTLEAILLKVAEAIGAVIQWVIDNWSLISTIGTVVLVIAAAFAALSLAVSLVNGVMAIFAMNPVVLAIIAIIAAITLCIIYWDEVKAAVASFAASAAVHIAAIAQFFKNGWENIKLAWAAAQPYFEMLWNAIMTVFSVVATVLGAFFKTAWQVVQIIWNVAVAFFTNVWNGIKAVFSVVKQVLSGDFQGAWNAIKTIFNPFITYFRTIWNTVKGIFSVVGTFFKTTFTTAWNNIKSAFSTVSTFFTGVWRSITNIFSKAGTTIGNAIKSVVSSAINKVLSTAVSLINGFIGAINLAIDVINAIPGVSISKLTKLTVPAMAKGGVVESATLAQIGERGAEAVVPLENNLEWLDKLAGMLNERMGGSAPIVLNVDGKRFAEVAVDSINDLTRQRGSIPLTVF